MNIARKTYRKKSTAKRAAKNGRSIYKVKHGWRIAHVKKRHRRKR